MMYQTWQHLNKKNENTHWRRSINSETKTSLTQTIGRIVRSTTPLAQVYKKCNTSAGHCLVFYCYLFSSYSGSVVLGYYIKLVYKYHNKKSSLKSDYILLNCGINYGKKL